MIGHVAVTVNDWNSDPDEVRLKLSSPSDESLEQSNCLTEP